MASNLMALLRTKTCLAAGSLARRFDWFCCQKILEQLQRIGPQSPGNGDELDEVDPAFATLILGDERLRSAELLRQGLLPHAGSMSHCDKQLDQAGIFRGFEGLLQGPPSQ